MSKALAARGRFLRAGGAVALSTALLAAWLGFKIGGDTVVRYVDDLATPLAALLATVSCACAAGRHTGDLRRFWSLLAVASGAWTLAEATWALYELVLREEVPVPSWADVGYLAAIPLSVAALLSHPAMRGAGTRRARSVVDAFLVAAALFFLSWTSILGHLWRSTDLTTAGGLVTVAYPFSDVLLVFFVVLVTRRMTGRDRLALWCLSGALVAMALSDSGYAYLTEVQSYAAGGVIDVGWVAGYLGIALGAYGSEARAGPARSTERSPTALAPVVLPFVPVLMALTVVGVQIQLGHPPDRVALVAAVCLVALVVIRQLLLVLDMVSSQGRRRGSIFARLYAAILSTKPDPVAPSTTATATPDGTST